MNDSGILTVKKESYKDFLKLIFGKDKDRGMRTILNQEFLIKNHCVEGASFIVFEDFEMVSNEFDCTILKDFVFSLVAYDDINTKVRFIGYDKKVLSCED